MQKQTTRLQSQKNLNEFPNSSSIGVFFAIITLVGDGFQTIISNLRPSIISPLAFSWLSACAELIILLPFFLYSRKHRNTNIDTLQNTFSRRTMWFRLMIAGIIFAGCAYFLILGFSLVDSVTGILAIKTQPISMIIIGAIFLKEKLSWREIIIGVSMLGLIVFVISKGTFDFGNFSMGAIYLIIVPIFWNIGHSIAKPYLTKNILTVIDFVFIRILITTFILGIFFFFSENWASLVSILRNSQGKLSVISMGILFALLHTCWYQAVRALPLSIASMIVIPSPVITAILAFFITHEPLFYYHYIGIFGEIIGLLILIQLRRNERATAEK